jgi:hypothetical protein
MVDAGQPGCGGDLLSADAPWWPVGGGAGRGCHGFIASAPGCAWLSSGRGPRPCPRSVVIAGDGACYMRAIEIHNALQYRQPVTFGLLDNHPHGTSVTPEQLYYHDRHSYDRPTSRPTTGEDRPDLLAKMRSDAGMPALDKQ